jgi:O-antigen ligase
MIKQTKAVSIRYKNGFKIFNFLNQSIPVLMGVFIFFNPFPHTTAVKEISFYLSGFFLIIVAVTPFKNRFSFENLLHNERIPNYYITYEIIKSYPIFGIGFGMQTYGEDINLEEYREKIPSKIKSIPAPTLGDPHNMVLDVAVRVGVFGLALSFYIVFVFFKMIWKIVINGKDKIIKNWGRCLAAAFIGVSFIGLFQPIFSHMPEVVFCIIFSMTTIIWRLDDHVAKDIYQRLSD